MRRSLAALAATSLAVTSVPASAQSVAGDMWAAVSNTFKNAHASACAANVASPSCVLATVNNGLDAMYDYADAIRSGKCSTNPATCTWMAIIQALGIEYPVPLGSSLYGGGSSGGSGASGSWCDELKWNLDTDGNMIVPSIPLAGGGPMARDQAVFQSSVRNIVAEHSKAAVLYDVHLSSLARASGDERAWYGCAWVNQNGAYTCRTVGHYVGTVKWGAVSSFVGVATRVYTYTKDCPEGGSTGGTFHYYVSGGSTDNPNCVMHAPEGLGTNGGYYYNRFTTIPSSVVAIWPNTTTHKYEGYELCDIDPSMIRRITDALAKKAAQQPGYAGPPYVPVTDDDVETGGNVPQVEDLPDATPPASPDDVPPPSPYPTPTPTPTPAPTDGPDYDPTVTNPELSAPLIDWWPDLPTLDVDLGAPECPIYQLQLPQWSAPFVLDSHCSLIEQYRSVISALMIASFTIMGFFLVLRA